MHDKDFLYASSIGYKKGKEHGVYLTKDFHGIDELYIVDVIHEMGHIVGLRHEFARNDWNKHLF